VDDFLAKNTRMDGVVTVVDAAHAAATLDAQFEAVSQAAMAESDCSKQNRSRKPC
jgi:G3E family GTPase